MGKIEILHTYYLPKAFIFNYSLFMGTISLFECPKVLIFTGFTSL